MCRPCTRVTYLDGDAGAVRYRSCLSRASSPTCEADGDTYTGRWRQLPDMSHDLLKSSNPQFLYRGVSHGRK